MSMALFKTDRSGRYKMDECVVLLDDMCDTDNDTPSEPTCEQGERKSKPSLSDYITCMTLSIVFIFLWFMFLVFCK